MVNTATGKSLRIEFFSNATGEQGQTFLGFLNVSMGASNTVVFTKTLSVPASVRVGHTLTDAGTDNSGDTSDF